MCDETTLAGWARAGGLTRRRFGALGLAGAAAACAPIETGSAEPASLREAIVRFDTSDGTMDAFFVHPASGSHPAVLFWPDIASIRESKKQMARRLAGSGYAVLVVNPYYRDQAAPVYADFAEFAADKGFAKIRPWREKLTAQAIMRDAASAVAWLDRQNAVDSERGVGTQGYCMGGPFTVWSAAAVPARIRAAASFHGGGLVREGDPLSPHRMLDESRARHLFAIAQDDDAEAPDDKEALRAAADASGRTVEIEVYPADHGWCVPDSPSYDPVQADRAWARLLALYGGALRIS